MTSTMLHASAKNWLSDVINILDVPRDENVKDTPRRIADTYTELLFGHSEDGKAEILEHLEKRFPTTHRELTIVKGINSAGVCPHHFLPVLYTVQFGYIPEKSALGLSKIPRIIKIMSARAVLQEDLTADIADLFQLSTLQPKGVAVVVHGFHTCMSIRGVSAREATTVTSAVRGIFLENDKGCKDEFLRILALDGGVSWG
jgi:GTP cyclohydrolase IA